MADFSSIGGLELQLPELPGNAHQETIYNEFVGVFNAIRRLQSAINDDLGLASASDSLIPSLPVTQGVSARKDRAYLETTEAVNYGQVVNIFPSGGVAKVRLARNTSEEYRCWGICNTQGSHLAGSKIEVAIGMCLVQSVGGLTPGQEYWLSSVGGIITNIPDPLTETNIRQSIGVALTATELWFFPQAPGKLVSIIITP